MTGNLQQTAVHRVGNSFFLHRGVNDHPLQVLGSDCFDGDSGVDGGFEQQLYAVFAQGFSEVADLCGIAGQAMLVVVQVVHAAEVLPDDVLTPARHQLFVTEVEAVLEVQQTDHQANGQFGPTGVAAPTSDHNHTDAKHVIGFEDLRVRAKRFWCSNLAAIAASI